MKYKLGSFAYNASVTQQRPAAVYQRRRNPPMYIKSFCLARHQQLTFLCPLSTNNDMVSKSAHFSVLQLFGNINPPHPIRALRWDSGKCPDARGHLAGEITSGRHERKQTMMGSHFSPESISVGAKRPGLGAGAVYYRAPWEPDESQQDSSRSVNHFLLRNTRSEPRKQIIGNDFMTTADHTSDPAGRSPGIAVQLWRETCSAETDCEGTSRHAVDWWLFQSLMGSGMYSSSK